MPFSFGDYVMPTGPVPRRGERGFVICEVDCIVERLLVRFDDGDEVCDADTLVLVRPPDEPKWQHRL